VSHVGWPTIIRAPCATAAAGCTIFTQNTRGCDHIQRIKKVWFSMNRGKSFQKLSAISALSKSIKDRLDAGAFDEAEILACQACSCILHAALKLTGIVCTLQIRDAQNRFYQLLRPRKVLVREH
jgi:hypothetical protein